MIMGSDRSGFFLLRWSSAVAAGALLLCLSGCTPILRETLNRRYPPIDPSQHQYAAIQTANRSLEALGSPSNIYAFLPKAALESYLLHVLARPIPLDDETLKILKAAPELLGTRVELAPGDMTINTFFRATHVSGIMVEGRIELHASPELLPGGSASISALRLRLSLARPSVYRIDASQSPYRRLQLLSETVRSIVSQTLELTLGNINATLQSAVIPLPLQPMVVGDDRTPEKRAADEAEENARLDKEGKPHPIRTRIEPPVLARLLPYLQNGTVAVRSEGIMVLGSVGIADVPKGPLKLPLPPAAQEVEPLPKRPPTSEEWREATERLNANSLQAFSQASGSAALPDKAVAGLAVQPLGQAVGSILNGKSFNIVGSGPVQGRDEDEPPVNIVIPKIPLYCDDLEIISCDGHEDVCTAQYSREAERAKAAAKEGLEKAHDALTALDGQLAENCKETKRLIEETKEKCKKFDLWGCVKSVTETVVRTQIVIANPAACADDKTRKAALDQLIEKDNQILGLAEEALANPEERGLALIDRLDQQVGSNLGQHYRSVCGYFNEYADRYGCEPLQKLGKDACEQIQKAVDHFQGAKVGDLDWTLNGEGEHALSFDLRLEDVQIAPDFMSVTADVSGSGKAKVSGWFKLHFEDAFRLALCASGQGAEGSVGPAELPARLAGKQMTGTVSFANAEQAPSRFTMSTDPIEIDLTTELPPLQLLLKIDNVLFPCPVSNFMWTGVLPLYKCLEWTKTPIPYKHTLTPDPIELTKLEPTLELPVRWKRKSGSPDAEPAETIEVPIRYQLAGGRFSQELGEIPAPPSIPGFIIPRRPLFVSAEVGLTVGALIGEPSDRSSTSAERGQGLTWMNPYFGVNVGSSRLGLLVAAGSGPGLDSTGVILGVKASPWPQQLPDLSAFGGVRFASGDSGRHARAVFGLSYSLGKLCLSGCGFD